MPFPDSKYPSVLRGYDKRQSERLAAAAPDLLAACRLLVAYWKHGGVDDGGEVADAVFAAIAKAEGQ